MIHFFSRVLVHPRNRYALIAQNSSMAATFPLLRHLSSGAEKHSFTVNYLTNKCGLSPESALKASKTVHLKTPDNPDMILSYFENLGFSKSHISQMVTKFPKFLSLDPHKTIFPKVEFFRSKGASTPELVNIFTVNPRILERSLQNRFVYCFKHLAELFQSEDRAIEVIKKNSWVLHNSPEAGWLRSINVLIENGVPETSFLWAIDNRVGFATNPDLFRRKVEEVKRMGFDPLKIEFVVAVKVLATMNKSTRDRKVEVFKSRGWSENDIIAAFKKNPWCLSIPEDTLMRVIDFYVSKMGLDCSVLVNRPILLGYSLTKRLIPRGAVIQFLLSNGLVKLNSRVPNMFICSEKRFLGKYVNCHKEAPLLTNLYNDKFCEATGKDKKKIMNCSVATSTCLVR